MTNEKQNIKALQEKILQRVEQYEITRKKRKQILFSAIPLVLLLLLVSGIFLNNLNEQNQNYGIDYIAETMDDFDLYAMADDDEIIIENDNTEDDCEIEYLANDPYLEFYLIENN
jgi:hypothetical protein